MDLLYFVILVSSLIFVHELGHFMFAKAFGVKVITFSLGFGPKILRLRGRETEYCVGLLPLGGYVKMLEASKNDIVLPEDRHRTFESLTLFKRVLVVLAGPVMNLIFPMLLYFAVFVSKGAFLPPTVGVVLPGHPADGVLQPGDRVMSINGTEVATFDELQRIVSRSPGQPLRFTVFRDNRHVEVEVVAEATLALLGSPELGREVEGTHLDVEEHIGTVGIKSSAPAPVIGVPDPTSAAHRAGLRTFDVITQVAGRPIERFMDIPQALAASEGATVPVTYLRPVPLRNALGGLAEMAVYEAGVVALTPESTGADVTATTGIESADLYAAVVRKGAPLYEAGLRPGDKLLELDGEPIPAWSTFHEQVEAKEGKPHEFAFLSAADGRKHVGRFQVGHVDLLGAENWVPVTPGARVAHPAPVRYALTKAVEETVNVTRFTFVLMVRLLEGRISPKEVQGPIAIYKAAGEEGRKGAERFALMMALISINLGLLNLLPIPVLDGGHLLFFIIEGIVRRPVPLRVREMAHLLGMAILVGLIAFVFKNDFDRHRRTWTEMRGAAE